MRILLLLFFVVGSISTPSFSQNLVNNWSFEDTIQCPPALSNLPMSSGWAVYNGSPDFYHSCNPGGTGPQNVSVPQNVVDFQHARSGNAYVGAVTYSTVAPNVREYFGTELTQPLTIGQKYYVKFYTSRAVNKTSIYRADVANDKIGMLFFIVPNAGPVGIAPTNYAQVKTDTIITDTLNWTEISGSFIADSNYTYIVIGNLYDGQNTNFIQYDSINTIAYYFFDDICVSIDSMYCEQLLNNNLNILPNPEIIDIFPNPARDWIVFRGIGNFSYKIIDVSGRIIRTESKVIAPWKIDTFEFPAGIYVVSIESENGNHFIKLIIYH